MKMHVTVMLTLCLQVFLAQGQHADHPAISLDEAISTALHNNPVTLSDTARKQLVMNVKSAWFSWLFNINRWKTLKEYQLLVKDIDRIAGLQFASGNMEWIEQSSWQVKLARINTLEAIAQNDTDIALQKIRHVLLIDQDITPSETTPLIYQIDKTGWPEKEDSLPLRDQALANAQSRSIKQLELDGLFIRLQFFYSYGLPHAETVLQVSGAKLTSEEIDYFEYVEQIMEAFNIKLEFLEILHNYNQCALQLENYAH